MNSRTIAFYKPWIDFSVFGGFSVLLLPVFIFLSQSSIDLSFIYVGSAWMLWILNHPHFAATSLRLYQYAEHRKQYPGVTWIAPFFFIAVGVFSIFHKEWIPFVVKVFLLWSPYHYAGQAFGIAMIYLGRSNRTLGSFERWLWYVCCFGSFWISTLVAEVSSHPRVFYDVSVLGIGLPHWVLTIIEFIVALHFLTLLSWLFYRRIKYQDRVPVLCWVAPLSLAFWFLVGVRYPLYSAWIPAFHSLQYLGIAYLAEVYEQKTLTQAGKQPFSISVRWISLTITGGVFLFYFLPKFSQRITDSDYGVVALVISLIQIHHFFVDGVIWKLRSRSRVSLKDLQWNLS